MKLSTVIRFILNFFDFFQQKKVIKFFKKNLDKKILILDVGSHHGETISLFSKNPLSATNSVEDEINASAPLALGSKKPLIFPSPGK